MGDVESMLGVLGIPQRMPSLVYLAELQRAWTMSQPFHNVDLLAGFAEGRRALDREDAWGRCLRGLGGPCHVQASGFLRLLEGLGFDAHLAAGTIAHPADHLLVAVHVGRGSWICDVGNGHPYLVPFPLKGAWESTFLGWSFRTSASDGELLLEQRTPGASHWRRVYSARADVVSWSHFAPAIERHHHEPSFGPFLTGLRGVRVEPDRVLTVRDDVFTVHACTGVQQRQLDDDHERVLVEDLRLGDLPVALAVATWRRNMSEGVVA